MLVAFRRWLGEKYFISKVFVSILSEWDPEHQVFGTAHHLFQATPVSISVIHSGESSLRDHDARACRHRVPSGSR